MTLRERKEARIEKRLAWSASADQESNRRFDTAHKIADGIPLGQPILVGHHSERHHRRDVERIDSNMRRAVEADKRAEHHRSVADGIAHQLDSSIFSDDSDATDALEARIAEREAERVRMKAINKAYKKGDAAALAALGLNLESLREKLNAPGVMSWCRIPYPSFTLTNLGARILADKKRLVTVKVRQARAEKAEQAGGTVVEDCGNDFCRVTFAEKPERDVLNALRAAGFFWGSGSWTGYLAKLPECLRELAPEGN